MSIKDLFVLLLDIVAVYRLTKLVIDDEIFSEVREAIWEKFPPHTSKLGYLITCPWCTSIWMGVGIFALRKLSPQTATYVSSVLASSAVSGLAMSRGL